MKYFFFFLTVIAGCCFGQTIEKKKSNNFYIEPIAMAHSLRFMTLESYGTGCPCYRSDRQSRLSININLGYRNEKFNVAVGSNLITIGSQTYLYIIPRFLYTREAYAKLGFNLFPGLKKRNEYFGPYGSIGYLILDPHIGKFSYKLGVEFYSSKRVRIGAYYGLFGYNKSIREFLEQKGEKLHRNNEFGISVGYSFPIRDPWLIHE